MSRYRSLTNLIGDVRSRTNQENSTFVTDQEITEYLNQSIAELEVRLVLNQGQPHFRSFTTIDVEAYTALYALPADFWTLQEVTATINSVTSPLMPFTTAEHGDLMDASLNSLYHPVRYRIQAGNIEFRPATDNFTATVYYTPTHTRLTGTFDVDGALTGSSDAWDGFNGYEMAPIYDACAQVMGKEDSDPSFFERQRDRIYATITQAAAHRDMSNPERVQDVSGEMESRLGWRFE